MGLKGLMSGMVDAVLTVGDSVKKATDNISGTANNGLDKMIDATCGNFMDKQVERELARERARDARMENPFQDGNKLKGKGTDNSMGSLADNIAFGALPFKNNISKCYGRRRPFGVYGLPKVQEGYVFVDLWGRLLKYEKTFMDENFDIVQYLPNGVVRYRAKPMTQEVFLRGTEDYGYEHGVVSRTFPNRLLNRFELNYMYHDANKEHCFDTYNGQKGIFQSAGYGMYLLSCLFYDAPFLKPEVNESEDTLYFVSKDKTGLRASYKAVSNLGAGSNSKAQTGIGTSLCLKVTVQRGNQQKEFVLRSNEYEKLKKLIESGFGGGCSTDFDDKEVRKVLLDKNKALTEDKMRKLSLKILDSDKSIPLNSNMVKSIVSSLKTLSDKPKVGNSSAPNSFMVNGATVTVYEIQDYTGLVKVKVKKGEEVDSIGLYLANEVSTIANDIVLAVKNKTRYDLRDAFAMGKSSPSVDLAKRY